MAFYGNVSNSNDGPTSLANDIISRWGQLDQDFSFWQAQWKEIADYIVPRRFDIDRTQVQGQKTGTLIYDGDPVTALQLLSDGLHGYLVSPSMQWFRLTMKRQGLNRIPAIREWLQNVEEEMYFAFQMSNFYNAMSEYFKDAGAFGTATLYSEENIHDQRIMFETQHPGEIRIAEDRYGEVDTVFRKFSLTAKQAAEMFGKANLSDALSRAAGDDKQMYQRYDFIHAVYPNASRDVGKVDQSNMAYKSVYMEFPKTASSQGTITATGNGHVVKQSGYRMNPYHTWRWSKNSGEVYGRGPGGDALTDVLRLNEVSRTLIIASQMAVEPPMNVPASMEGSVRIRPRGLNYYNEESKAVITPVNLGSNHPIALDREEKIRSVIEKHFRVDFFLMLSRAEKTMTATEIIEKAGEKAAVLGPVIGRLNTECLNKVIDRVFDILWNARRLPPPPDELAEVSDGRIDVEYMGPLAQAQKRLFRTQGVMASLEQLSSVFRIQLETTGRADAADRIDFDEATLEILDANGCPQRIIKSDEDMKAMREARAQQQQQQQRLAAMESGSSSVKSLAQADRASEGAISKMMQQQMAGGAVQ